MAMSCVEQPDNWTSSASFPSVSGQGREQIDTILAKMGELGWDGRDVFGVEMALEEAIANAIMHGNRYDAAKKFHIECLVTGKMVRVNVQDEGIGFNWHDIPDPREATNIDCPSGRGILLIRGFMNDVSFNESGNRIQMVKHRK